MAKKHFVEADLVCPCGHMAYMPAAGTPGYPCPTCGLIYKREDLKKP